MFSMLFIHRLLLFPLGLQFLCWALVVYVVLGVISSFSNHLAEKWRAGCLNTIVLWLSVLCLILTAPLFDLRSVM